MSLTGSHEDDDIEGLESEEESLSDSINDSPEIVSESESASESSDIFEETENVLNEYKETIDNIRRKKVSNFKWDLQGEMQADFGKDPELVKKLYIKMNEALASLMQTSKASFYLAYNTIIWGYLQRFGYVDFERVGSSAGLCFLLATVKVIRSGGEGEGFGRLYNGLKLSVLGTVTSHVFTEFRGAVPYRPAEQKVPASKPLRLGFDAMMFFGVLGNLLGQQGHGFGWPIN
uniref:Nucleolar transcription factor 1-A-like n=1 Tax=Tanacetum cinerariifolium TaxID=118510 RepID=A0A6L2NI51_TANCI|nr:nucleolar transcription factor 1-A-like [Tanacetum cinerariifolium]